VWHLIKPQLKMEQRLTVAEGCRGVCVIFTMMAHIQHHLKH